MIKVILSIIILLFCNPAWSATKVIDMVENSSPTVDDVTYCADGGVLDRKCELGNIVTLSGWTTSGSDVTLNSSLARIGVGTTSPQYVLDVDGQINTSTGISLNGIPYCLSDGTNCIDNSFNPSSYGQTTWGNGSTFSWIMNSGATQPTLAYGNGTTVLSNSSLEIEGPNSGIELENGIKIDNDVGGKIGLTQAGGVNNENIRFDLDTTVNKVTIDSTSGVSEINFSAIDLVTTGDINTTGAVTASTFSGDGSALTGITAGINWQSYDAISTLNDSDKVFIGVGTNSKAINWQDLQAILPSGSVTINTTSPVTGAGSGTSFTIGVDETKLTLSNLGGSVTDGQVPNNITVDLAATATALAANPVNCAAGNYPLGVDASGTVEDCTPISSGSVGIGTANTITFWPTTTTIGSLPTDTYPSLTELSYVKGATSSLQTQIDGLGGSSGWTDGGTNVYNTNTTDNVGIGTTTPNATLLVENVTTSNSFRVNDSASDTTPFTITSAGNVGIGTSLPTSTFMFTSTAPTSNFITMSTASAPTMAIRSDAASGTDLLNIQGSSLSTGNALDVSSTSSSTFVVPLVQFVTFGANMPYPTLFVQQGGIGEALKVNDVSGDTTPFVVSSVGNVGIGTITPVAQLDIRFQTPTPPLMIGNSATDETGAYLVMNSGGNLGIGSISPSTKLAVVGTVSATAFSGDGSALTGLSAGGWTDGGTNVYVSPTTDNVGIGTTTPSTNFKADIRGNLYVSGNVGIGTLLPRGTLDLGPTGTVYAQTFTGPTGPTILGTSNNVGIGTITAGSLLTVGSTGQVTVSSAGAIATSSTVSVADDAYAAGWNASTAVPTKNAVYDKIETLGAGYWTDAGAFTYLTTTTDNVGIGTVAPDQRLKVEGSSAANISTMVRNSNSSGLASVKVWNSANLGFEMVATGSGYAVPSTYGVLATAGESLSFGESDGTINMRVNPAGTVRFTPTDTPDTCNAGNEGSLYYDNSLNEFCDCDGSSWAQVDGGGAC